MLCYKLATSFKPRILPLGKSMQLRYSSHRSVKARKALSSLKQSGATQLQVSTPKTSKPNITPRLATKIHSPPSSALTLEVQLGSLKEPTLLYCKSYWKISLTSYVIAGLGLGAIYNNYSTVPMDTPTWIRATNYVTIVLMGIAVVAVFVYPAR